MLSLDNRVRVVAKPENHTPQALTISMICTLSMIFKGSVHYSEHSPSSETRSFAALTPREIWAGEQDARRLRNCPNFAALADDGGAIPATIEALPLLPGAALELRASCGGAIP
jgi:hypothetical protein